VGEPFLGITYGPQIQMYYLIAAWLLACTGRDLRPHAHAARAHGQRDCATTRSARNSWATTRSGALHDGGALGILRGIAGGLAALNYEIVSAESLSAYTSGLVLLGYLSWRIRLFGGRSRARSW
jgi:branched-chain amino acid transport system permease protein